MIVAFSGRKFAGKDSTAEGLIRFHKFKRIGLADRLKDICSHIFEIDRKDMDDPFKKEVTFENPICIRADHIRDLLDLLRFDEFVFDEQQKCKEICKNFIGKNLTSIRDMLQTVGTDICRTYIQDDIWLEYVKDSITKSEKDIVITDARFKNERDYLKSLGAVLVLVKRESLGETTESHISENQLGDEKDYDVIVYNNDTLTALQSDIAMWYVMNKDAIASNNERRKKIS